MKILLTMACLALAAPVALAQDTNNNEENNSSGTSRDTNNRFWEARLPGGSYLVSLSKISSISIHRYNVGNIEVVEAVVDTDGNALARFYAFNLTGENSDANIAKNSINRAREILRDQSKRAGVNGAPVTKDYPNTTHAKTIEYLLSDAKAVESLFNSARRAWTRNRGTRFTIK